MMSEQNLKDLEDAGLKFVVGARIPEVPYLVAQWQSEHPGEPITGWSIKKLAKTLRRYHTIQIQVGDQTITAADPLPEDALSAITKIRAAAAAH